SATCVRVPVFRAHSVAINAEFEKPVDLEEARRAIAAFPGSELVDDTERNEYPMPLDYSERVPCGIGRLRVPSGSARCIVRDAATWSWRCPDPARPWRSCCGSRSCRTRQRGWIWRAFDGRCPACASHRRAWRPSLSHCPSFPSSWSSRSCRPSSSRRQWPLRCRRLRQCRTRSGRSTAATTRSRGRRYGISCA
ncbi:MAG: hypothetical protein IIA33_11285, partial [Planctomycetes bacterium]|nr:hypothetical protein [Planctomycetota bacterium]